MRETEAYYRDHATEYFAKTVSANMADAYRRFLERVPAGGSILDVGCGSGRDSLHFIEHGYRVTALDSSPELASLASRHIGQEVIIQSFYALSYHEAFDGVWASASLVHCPRGTIDNVLRRVVKALKRGGTLYMSFKLGNGERTAEDNRFFNDYNERTLRSLCDRFSNLSEPLIWQTESQLPDSKDIWLSCLATKLDTK